MNDDQELEIEKIKAAKHATWADVASNITEGLGCSMILLAVAILIYVIFKA